MKTFDIHTQKGINDAERYQNKLYKKYDKVKVRIIGNDRILIRGE